MENRADMVVHKITEEAGVVFTGLRGAEKVIITNSEVHHDTNGTWVKTGATFEVDASTIEALQAIMANCREIAKKKADNNVLLEKVRKNLGMPFPRIYGDQMAMSG